MSEAGHVINSIYCLLNNTILKFDSCLNHLVKPIVTDEKVHHSFNYPDRAYHVKHGVIDKISISSFEEAGASALLDKIKQNIYLWKKTNWGSRSK